MRTFPAALALAAAALLALPLSGCLSATVVPAVDDATPAPEPLPEIYARVRAALEGVPCDGGAIGSASSPNLVRLAGISIPSSQDGIHGELDIRGDLAVHARYASSGFELYDIRDPMAPVHLGNWTAEANDGALDVKFSPDNATVLVGVGNAIHLVDVRDPMHPVQVGDWKASEATPTLGGAATILYNSHMLYTKRIAGDDWVFLAPNSNSGVWILRMAGGPDRPQLSYVTQTLPIEGGPLGPHDMYVQRDGLDGHWYLYSADGFHGWTAFNVDDPAHPKPAGGFVNPAEAAYTHSIQAATVNGKRIVATIAEIGADYLRLYDASNLAAPILLGIWQAETTPQGATSPEHNFNIADGNLYLSYYGHGMYIFNLTAITAGPSLPGGATLSLKPNAHWSVDGEGVDQGFTGFWDTLVKDGVIYVSHIEGGLVVLGYGCSTPGNTFATSDG